MNRDSTENKSILQRLIGGNGTGVSVIILLVFLLVAAIAVPKVFQLDNIANILRTYSPAGIMAIGLSLVLLTGEIDVSIGTNMSFTIMLATIFMDKSEGTALAVLLIAGGLCGLINGLIITKIKVPSLMVTIGTMSLFNGLASIIVNAQGKFITEVHPFFTILAKSNIGGIPSTFIICLAVSIVCWWFTSKTRFGRQIYYTGANKRAAWMSGIDIDKVKIIVYVICGVLAAMAGPLITTQIGVAKCEVGVGYEVTAIAIAVLGGVSLDGGKGSIFGVLCGMFTMGLLMNMLALSGMGTYVEMAMKGILIIAVVFVYGVLERRKR